MFSYIWHPLYQVNLLVVIFKMIKLGFCWLLKIYAYAYMNMKSIYTFTFILFLSRFQKQIKCFQITFSHISDEIKVIAFHYSFWRYIQVFLRIILRSSKQFQELMTFPQSKFAWGQKLRALDNLGMWKAHILVNVTKSLDKIIRSCKDKLFNYKCP